jgi:HK97 family phage portal protein
MPSVKGTIIALRNKIGGMFKRKQASLSGVDARGGWWPIVFESFKGAWQSNVEINHDAVMAQATVFSCITLAASDGGKLRLKLTEMNGDGIWLETSSPAFSPVLRKPNHYQTRQQFIEQWLISKLSAGNAYILKQRDSRKVVTALYVLDPHRVKPLVAPNGDVYYQIHEDDLSHVPEGIHAIPASEIIHDRMNCLFHPLVGLSPIFACGLAATQGLKIQQNSAKFFENMSRPSGVLTAPGQISDVTAARLKAHWETNFSGENIGKVAVLGDALKYESMSVDPVDAQVVEQLKMSSEQVCSTFHIPAYMVGAAPAPAYNNIEALNQQYYSQCLQSLLEAIEAGLDEGLGLPYVTSKTLSTEFDLDGLLRMDSLAQIEFLEKAVKGIMSADEARRKLNLPPTPGGGAVLTQQQNYSLEAIAKRDAKEDPFATGATPAEPNSEDIAAEEARAFLDHIRKGLECETK